MRSEERRTVVGGRGDVARATSVVRETTAWTGRIAITAVAGLCAMAQPTRYPYRRTQVTKIQRVTWTCLCVKYLDQTMNSCLLQRKHYVYVTMGEKELLPGAKKQDAPSIDM